MSKQNLKPFKKGVSGNIKGRPKGSRSLTAILKDMMEKKLELLCPMEGMLIKRPIAEHLSCALLASALRGDLRALREVLDRVDGKAVEPYAPQKEERPEDLLSQHQIDEIIRFSQRPEAQW